MSALGTRVSSHATASCSSNSSIPTFTAHWSRCRSSSQKLKVTSSTHAQHRSHRSVWLSASGKTSVVDPVEAAAATNPASDGDGIFVSQQEGSPPPSPPPAAQFTGVAELLVTTCLWGSYNPTLKMIYAEDHPLDPATLTAIRTVLSAAALGVAVAARQQHRQNKAGQQQQRDKENGVAASSVPASKSGGADTATTAAAAVGTASMLSFTFSTVLGAGIELGVYNFAGTAMQAISLQMISATRAGFLQQLIAVVTPVLAYLAGEKITPRVWTAVAIGFAGSLVLACDGLPLGDEGFLRSFLSGGGTDEMKGTAIMLASNIFYSLSVVRLSMYAPKFDTIDLTAVKKFTLGAASTIWMFSILQDRFHGMGLGDQLVGAGLTDRSFNSWALICFSGLGPGALATYLQTKGQSSVPAVQAQIIFSLTPLWSAFTAYLLLGDEGMGPLSWLGGAALIGAGIMAATAPKGKAPPAAAAAAGITASGSGVERVANGEHAITKSSEKE